MGRVPMNQKNELPRTLSALDDLFELLEQAFEKHSVDKKSAFWINLAAEELFTNMVRHNQATGDKIELELDIDPERISLAFTDFGVEAFDGAENAPVDVTLPTEERTPGGLGVHLVQSTMDDLEYKHDGGNMTVSFTRFREASNE